MRAIDLYAGIGGWSLGLRLAGIEVVASYERWHAAIDTHNGNHGGSIEPVDIRKLDVGDLPKDIDLVVGSPPCTEFSYSNRGGSGNLSEGLKDLVKFLEIVDHLQPRYWALENVPRVADVLREGFQTAGHPLHRFSHLTPEIEIIDFSRFGTPQSRRRCIAGNIPFELIKAYSERLPPRTLGDVVRTLSAKSPTVRDPVWSLELPRAALTEMEAEPALNAEERRMNEESKTYHPIYNNMSFPDALDAPARTVTATCTRVSRESIVIADPEAPGAVRRLTIRERASLQGFPITYQFFARSFAEKAKMVGNAIPPTFTYLVAMAAREIPAEAFHTFDDAAARLTLPPRKAPVTPPTAEGRTYPAGRTFRAALKGLRFKSGMRFELANMRGDDEVSWNVRFFFGPSSDIREIELDTDLLRQLRSSPFVHGTLLRLGLQFAGAEQHLNASTPADLQASWSHRAHGLGPYEVADLLARLADAVLEELRTASNDDQHAVMGYVLEAADEGEVGDSIPGSRKLRRYALEILSGMLVGAWFNSLDWHSRRQAAA